MSNVTIGGNTYNVRDLIKVMGGTYNPANKTWTMPAAKWERLRTMDNGRRGAGLYVVKAPSAANWQTDVRLGYAEG